MILVSFGLWFVVVYGVRIALLGNPLYHMVSRADPGLLTGVDALIMGQKRDATEMEARFVRTFTHVSLLQLLMLFLELVLLIHLFWVRILPALTLGLFIKDMLTVGLGVVLARRQRAHGVITIALRVPHWALTVERVSAGLSAVGAFVLFLTVNELVFL